LTRVPKPQMEALKRYRIEGSERERGGESSAERPWEGYQIEARHPHRGIGYGMASSESPLNSSSQASISSSVKPK